MAGYQNYSWLSCKKPSASQPDNVLARVDVIVVSNTWLSGGHLMWSILPSEASAWKVASDWLRYARGSLLFMLYWHTVGVGRLGRREQEDHNNNLNNCVDITISHSGTVTMLCWLPHHYWGLRIKGCEDMKTPGVGTTNSFSILWGWEATAWTVDCYSYWGHTIVPRNFYWHFLQFLFVVKTGYTSRNCSWSILKISKMSNTDTKCHRCSKYPNYQNIQNVLHWQILKYPKCHALTKKHLYESKFFFISLYYWEQIPTFFVTF